MSEKEKSVDVVYKLLIHITQSMWYLENHDIKKSIAWRMEHGYIKKKDMKYIELASRLLSDLKFSIKKDEEANIEQN